ncbi:MAG: type II secretion system F family protein [Candidatus Portnoybacteria bacterium]|nr:type II secretion system F family protein [Candidatus Portnoybacteria bacterium]MDD4982755.1 type II secretion system F family protein [Candidatus Portnoybacteria bacterium]
MAGEEKTGSQEAASEADLAHALREQGFILTSVHLAGQAAPSQKLFPSLLSLFSADFLSFLLSVPLSEKMIFARHLSVMIGAGLAMNRALEILGLQTKNKYFSKVIKEVNISVKQGQALADSMSRYPMVFSELFVNMVRVGEAGGNLEETLKILAGQMEKDYELKSKVRSAMIYPAIIVTVMLGIGLLMMVAVVPKLTQIFKEMAIDLPLSTRLIIGTSDILSQYWAFGILGLIALIAASRLAAKTTTGKTYIDWVILRLPVIGGISKKINSARLARTLSALIESSVPIVQALQIIAGTLSNSFFRRSLEEAAVIVQKGAQLSKFIDDYPQLYPAMVSQMITVGEETGTLGNVLAKLADFYEEEVSDITKSIASIIEPALMVAVGAAVGFFAISMLQPMYSLMQGM